MGTGFQPGIFEAKEEYILLTPLATLIPGTTIFTEQNVVSMNLSLTLQGGSFSISVLRGTVNLKQFPENAVLSLPFGRVGVVTNIGTGWSSGGIVDTLSGPIISISAYNETFFGLAGTQNATLSYIASYLLSNGLIQNSLEIGTAPPANYLAGFSAPNPFVTNFTFRGKCISGLQQVAGIALADLILRTDGWHFVNPGVAVGQTWSIPSTDIISVSQVIDTSLDVSAVLNPAVYNKNFSLGQSFVYDSDHAQKQPKYTVRAGSPALLGAPDFIEIPDGWLVDGAFEEWLPNSPTDLTNPSSTVTNGRYWKVFPSPANPGMMRGITSFTRLVKQVVTPGNVSSFIGSPITGLTKQDGPQEFAFDFFISNNGIYGLDSSGGSNGLGPGVSFFDVISNQFVSFNNAICLIPQGGGDSGDAAENFYSITVEQWTFPLVNPTTFFGGPSANPFDIPANYAIVTPNTNILNGAISGFYNQYMSNYGYIHSPRQRTTASLIYRNNLIQPGDILNLGGVTYSNCGRVSTVSLNFSRGGGVVMNVVAEIYACQPGKWSYNQSNWGNG